jgi:hypothetical protein
MRLSRGYGAVDLADQGTGRQLPQDGAVSVFQQSIRSPRRSLPFKFDGRDQALRIDMSHFGTSKRRNATSSPTT